MKLPEKLYEPKHSKELRSYARGWNYVIDYVSRKCSEYTDHIAEICLADLKEAICSCVSYPYYKGQYACILEIEKLNKEKEEQAAPIVLGFRMVKDKYICFDEDYTCPIFNRDKWKCQYCINTKTDKCPLLLP